jgi:hypothetical protein
VGDASSANAAPNLKQTSKAPIMSCLPDPNVVARPGSGSPYDGGRAGLTTILPTMYGWIEQK